RDRCGRRGLPRSGEMIARAFAILALAGSAAACGNSASPDVTWSKDVAPIVARECASCHRKDGIAPFALDRYADAASAARSIVPAVKNRTMPPSVIDASGACNRFTGARWLSDKEIDLFDRWVTGGMREGAAPSADPMLASGVAHLESPSATLDIGTAYEPRA